MYTDHHVLFYRHLGFVGNPQRTEKKNRFSRTLALMISPTQPKCRWNRTRFPSSTYVYNSLFILVLLFFFFVALNVNKFLISFVVVIIFINLIYPCQIDVVCLFKLAFLSLSLPSTHICLLPVSYVVYISNFNFQASVSVLYTRFISHYLHISESFLSVFPDLISNVILFTRFHCMFISS